MDMTNEAGGIRIDVDGVSKELRIRPEIYMKIVSSFAQSLGGKMKILNDALAVNNTDQIRMILHEIKGTAGNLRLKNISDAEAVMHVAVKAGENSKALGTYFETLKKETERLQQYVGKFSNN